MELSTKQLKEISAGADDVLSTKQLSELKAERAMSARRKSFKVLFDTSPYENSYMQPPRGRGSWAFAFVRRNAQLDDMIWSPSMTYGEAKRWVRDAIRGTASDAISPELAKRNEATLARILPRVVGSHVCVYVQS